MSKYPRTQLLLFGLSTTERKEKYHEQDDQKEKRLQAL